MSRTQPHLLKIKSLLTQKTKTDRLPRHRGNRRDTHVDRSTLKLQIDSPVLRQPPLCNIQMRHNFDSRNQRGLEQLDPRGNRNITQDPVNAIPNLQIILQRLDMNICRPLLQSLTDHLIHKFNHRRLRIIFIQYGRFLFEIISRGKLPTSLKNFIKGLRTHPIPSPQSIQNRPPRRQHPFTLPRPKPSQSLPGQMIKGIKTENRKWIPLRRSDRK